MPVVKLDRRHIEAVKPLFNNANYMGNSVSDTDAFKIGDSNAEPVAIFNSALYLIFCSNYLSDLNNYHAFGYVEDGEVKALISFYESVDEPAWYYTVYRSSGNNQYLKEILDQVIKYNEAKGRLKFYTLVHQKHSKLLRRFTWSNYNDERYGYFDEYLVPSKNKCYYTNAWELLYKRFLLPEDSVVRCNYLKQEYRVELPIGGNI